MTCFFFFYIYFSEISEHNQAQNIFQMLRMKIEKNIYGKIFVIVISALKALSKDTSNYRVVSYAFHQKSKSFKSQDSNKRKAALQTPECTPSKAAKLSNSEL